MIAYMYHNIDKPPKEAKLKTLYLKPSMFKRQLYILSKLGYKSISGKDNLLNIDLEKNYEKKIVLLTFDDGYKDFIQNAYPTIEEYGYKAIIFVVANEIGNFNRWDYKVLNVKKYLMDLEDLRFLIKKGFIIGSHTLNHPFLTKISKEEAKKEIEYSKKLLEDKLGVAVETFCYPYGDYNQDIAKIVEEAGYKYAFTTKDGKIKDSEDRFQLKRINIFGNTYLPKFILKTVRSE